MRLEILKQLVFIIVKRPPSECVIVQVIVKHKLLLVVRLLSVLVVACLLGSLGGPQLLVEGVLVKDDRVGLSLLLLLKLQKLQILHLLARQLQSVESRGCVQA